MSTAKQQHIKAKLGLLTDAKESAKKHMKDKARQMDSFCRRGVKKQDYLMTSQRRKVIKFHASRYKLVTMGVCK